MKLVTLNDFTTEDDYFNKLHRSIDKYTIVDRQKLYVLYQFAKQVRATKPNPVVAEIGVYKGGSGLLFANTIPDGLLYFFDTFQGLPKPIPFVDGMHTEGNYASDERQVRQLFRDFKNVEIHKGEFPSCAPDHLKLLKFDLVHIDVDLYRGITECLDWFYPKMNPGGLIISDDYKSCCCPGARKAVDEWCEKNNNVPITLATEQGLIWKIN